MLGRLAGGLTFLSAVAFAPRSIINTLLFEPDGALVPAKPLPPNPFVRDGKALVAIVRGDDPLAMLQAGLNLIGGIGRLGLHGKRVLIKPNVVNDRPPPPTTLVRIIPPRDRPSVSFPPPDGHERIAELNLAVHPHLTIADGTTLMIAGGPTSGTPARADILLVSGDRIALDAVAVALIRTFGAWPQVTEQAVWEQRQIKRAIELGLGIQGPSHIELVTQSLAGPDASFERLVATIRKDLGV